MILRSRPNPVRLALVIQRAPASATETKTLIHLKTSGLTSSRNRVWAETNEKIEFRVPEASGVAVGATDDSHNGVLALKSGVKIVTSDKNRATITGESASISKTRTDKLFCTRPRSSNRRTPYPRTN